MSNPQKAKGTRWETAIVAFLRACGLRAFKPRQEGHGDLGDVHVGRFVIQAKDWRDLTAALREGLEGAVRQAATVDSLYPGARSVPVAVVKRARRPVAEAYAVLRLTDLAELMRELDG